MWYIFFKWLSNKISHRLFVINRSFSFLYHNRSFYSHIFKRIGRELIDVPEWMAMVQETDNLCDSKLLTNLCCNSTSDISYLKRLGLAKDISGEGSIIETSQAIRLRLPDLHNDTLTTSKEARIWLNMYESSRYLFLNIVPNYYQYFY